MRTTKSDSQKREDRTPISTAKPLRTGPQNGERVDHPAHYGGDTTYEPIKVIEAWSLDFCLGNAVKYIARAGKKDPAKRLEDLRKAAWYLNHEIERSTTK